MPALTRSELASLHATLLPDREALSVLATNVADFVNSAVADSLASDGSAQQASSVQHIVIDQS